MSVERKFRPKGVPYLDTSKQVSIHHPYLVQPFFQDTPRLRMIGARVSGMTVRVTKN